jgi:hypothetical protein
VKRVFFTDRDLGKQFPAILAAAGLSVERHADLFPPDGSDEQWLEHCGRHARIAITHNHRIRYVPNELAAVRKFGVRLLVVIGQAPTAELARNFVSTLGRIEAVLAELPAPAIVKVYRAAPGELKTQPHAPGRVEVWLRG